VGYVPTNYSNIWCSTSIQLEDQLDAVATFGALLVAAVSPLYQILKRHYDVKNATLESRIKLARELKDACEQWSAMLEQTFDKAVDLLNEKGPEAARSEILRQQQNFTALDYEAMTYNSEALRGLRVDPRFEAFSEACMHFYEGAIAVKRIAYQAFDEAGKARTLSNDGFRTVAQLWKNQVEEKLAAVRSEFRSVEHIHHA
jgi:hypothetical protein